MALWNVGGSSPLALVARHGRWWRFSWSFARPRRATRSDERARKLDRLRYHLGRGRRAREKRRYEAGAAEARRALDVNPRDPWAYALLGQCLAASRNRDLAGARHALERARTLDPMNGYFVRLLLDVLDAQHDAAARADVLAWAWWSGAPVERWLSDGPPMPRPVPRPASHPLEPGGDRSDETATEANPQSQVAEAATDPTGPEAAGDRQPVYA